MSYTAKFNCSRIVFLQLVGTYKMKNHVLMRPGGIAFTNSIRLEEMALLFIIKLLQAYAEF